jgi:hypothetical protein
MLVRITRRFTGSLVAVSLTLMALSVCASGPMTITEMVCCAEHHDDCQMAGQAGSCCTPDFGSDMGALAAERSVTTHVASMDSHMVATQPHQAPALLSTVRSSALIETLSALDGAAARPLLLSTILLI